MDFALLPPEINSGRMYSGAGPGPMLAAASSWDALAAELHTVGAGYESVLAELANGWLGPSATAMAAAAAPYATWMHSTAVQAEQTAVQAKAAAAAYETAFAMTVPPPVVAANRAQLMALLATNFLGQNTPAIAATEAHYGQMWAQDAAAMYGYADSAAAASQLAPFTEPPQTTNPAGSAAQAGAVGQATATSAGSHTNTLISAITHALQGLTSPGAATPPPNPSPPVNVFGPAAAAGPAIHLALAGTELGVDAFGAFAIDSAGTFVIDAVGSAVIWEDILPLLPLAGLTSSVTPVAASVGNAASLSGLSVPQAWTVAASSLIQQVGTSLPGAGAATVSAVAASETAIPFAEMAGAGLAGRAMASAGRGPDRAGTTTRQRPAPQQPQQEQPEQPRYGLINGVEIELGELAELRAARILTDEEYTRQKRRLLGR